MRQWGWIEWLPDYSRHVSPDLKRVLAGEVNRKDIIEVRTGSDSDFMKIDPFLEVLRSRNIAYYLDILSAHRNPKAMAEVAKHFPKLLLHSSLQKVMDVTWVRVQFAVGAAWGSAHIAGMSASETQVPFLALPVISSACGLDDSSLSMINMPPHKPNGFVPNNITWGRVAQKLFDLDVGNWFNKISLDTDWLSENDYELLKKLWLEIDESNSSPIKIHPVDLQEMSAGWGENDFDIFIPLKGDTHVGTLEMLDLIQNHENAWVYMWMQNTEGTTNYTNAIIYAAQVLGMFSPNIRVAAESHSRDLEHEVSTKNLHVQMQQLGIDEDQIINLPPKYKHLYSWKVRELYEYPGNPDLQIIISTDRISTHDIVHKNTIPWKGKVLTQISRYWFDKIQEDSRTSHIPTQMVEDVEWPDDFPEYLRKRSVIVKKAIPIPVECIARSYHYGSAENGYNPETGCLKTGEQVWTWLKKCSKYDKVRFTPSTKSNSWDVNINFEQMVMVLWAWLIEQWRTDLDARQLAEQLKEHTLAVHEVTSEDAESKGIIVGDQKQEYGIGPDGKIMIIDEICTPDSGRLWKKETVKEGEEPESYDKQPVRDEVLRIWEKIPDEHGRVKWDEWWKKYPVWLSEGPIWECSQRYNHMDRLFS